MFDQTMNSEEAEAISVDSEAFSTMVRNAAHRVFGNSEISRQIDGVIERMHEDCWRLHDRGEAKIPTIAIVGRFDEGWLAQCFLEVSPDDEYVRDEITTTSNGEDSPQTLLWFGPEKPFGLSQSGERFVEVPYKHMFDLGKPYVVGNTPGFSDNNPSARLLSSIAVTSAPIKLVVVPESQLRDGGTEQFVESMGGSLIVPVIQYRPKKDDNWPNLPNTLKSSVEKAMQRWRSTAPLPDRILDPCYIPDGDILGSNDEARKLTRQSLQEALAPLLADIEQLHWSAEGQIGQRLEQAREEIAELLVDFRNRVGSSIEKLEEMSRQLPDRLQIDLLGEDHVLRAGLRQRLRADWMERIPLFCFPYRSCSGILALTHGAWDRLVFSAMGSVPSLALTFFKSSKNIRDAQKLERHIREGIRNRTENLLRDVFRPAIRNFQTAVKNSLLLNESPPTPSTQGNVDTIRIFGLEWVETASRRIMSDTIEKYRAFRATVWGFAFSATCAFGYLIAGPLMSLYRTYLEVHGKAFGSNSALDLWKEFPTPSLSMLLASLLLSIGPVLLLALIGIWWSCNGKRVERTVQAVITEHQKEIDRRFTEESLRIELTDPQLEAARFLLTLKPRHILKQQ